MSNICYDKCIDRFVSLCIAAFIEDQIRLIPGETWTLTMTQDGE